MKFDYEAMNDEQILEIVHDFMDGSEETETDSAEAAAAAKICADRGNAEAQFLYGTFLMQGKGVEKDENAAGEYWLRSAEQGYAPADNVLGICNMAGVCGFENDPAKAAGYFMKAARNGFAESNLHLFRLYKEGAGVEKDNDKALEHLKAACDGEFAPAMVIMGMEILQTAASSPELQAEAVGYFLKAAEKSDPIGQLMYGNCCENGVGVEKDLSEAAGWYRKSAKAGNIQANEALKNLGFPGVM